MAEKDDIKTQETDSKVAPEGTQSLTTGLRGEYMAYALQGGLYQLAANVYEPYINYRVQRYYARQDPSHLTKHGDYKQNLAGEIIGDVTGAGTLMLAEVLCPGPLHSCVREFRKLVDPAFTQIAKAVFKNQKDDPDYEQKMNEWKVYQERNLARSLIVAAGGMTGNVLAQKHLVGNPSPTKLIVMGKLASTALTTGITLGVRLMYPKQTKSVDKWLSDKVFSPLIKPLDNHPFEMPDTDGKTKGEVAAKSAEGTEAEAPKYNYNASPYAPAGSPLSFTDRFAIAGGHSIPESNLSYAQRLKLDSKQVDPSLVRQ